MDLLISYRRKDWVAARTLANDLGKLIEGSIFIDYKSIDETEFEKSILNHIGDATAVLVLVTEKTFAADRIHNDHDWVRKEIAIAEPNELGLSKEGNMPGFCLLRLTKPIVGA